MEIKKKHNWFISGGSGFIASYTIAELLAQGQKVTVYDLAPLPSKFKGKVTYIKGDITDLKKLNKSVKGAEYVLHMAAQISVVASVKNPAETYCINAGGTLNVLEAARFNKVKRVVFSSSASVYGGACSLCKESSAPDCRSPYAYSKLMGEELMKFYFKYYGLETVTLRYFNVYGPGQKDILPYASVVSKFVAQASAGRALTVESDGKQTRDFVFAKDVAQANILAALKSAPGEIYNVGLGKSYNMLRLAKSVCALFGRGPRLLFNPSRNGDLRSSKADISKIKKIGFKPLFDLERGLKEFIK